MSSATITIVGTGVIGTSLGLALKQHDSSLRLVAHDKELSAAQAAAKQGAFDKVEWNLINACDQADMIVLAIPLGGIRPTLEAIAGDLKPGAIITDTATSKLLPQTWARELLPEQVYFVGGHPLVHPGGTGPEFASPNLFRERRYCLTPSPAAHEQAIQSVVGLINMIGAEPFFLDAAEHDGLATATEHLPGLLSIAAVRTLSRQNAWRELRALAGRLFEQVTAGAEGDPDSLREEFQTNRTALVHWLELYIHELQQLQSLIETPSSEAADETLAQTIDEAVVTRTNWLKDFEQGRLGDSEQALPELEPTNFFRQMIGFGGLWRKPRDSSKK